jgi:hypothetical protein
MAPKTLLLRFLRAGGETFPSRYVLFEFARYGAEQERL